MRIRSSKTSLTCAVGFVLITSLPIQAWAGAAYIYEFGSPTDVGTAGAGFAVKAQNASTVFGNPAGMTRFGPIRKYFEAGSGYAGCLALWRRGAIPVYATVVIDCRGFLRHQFVD